MIESECKSLRGIAKRYIHYEQSTEFNSVFNILNVCFGMKSLIVMGEMCWPAEQESWDKAVYFKHHKQTWSCCIWVMRVAL